MAVYSLARLRYPGRRILFLVIVSTLMIPGLNYPNSHVYHRPVVRLVGHLLGAHCPGLVQCLWDFSFATILS